MIEATVLYSVAAVVVAGLAVWVAVVLKSAKEPWARPALAAGGPVGLDLDADATSKATPIAKAIDAAKHNAETVEKEKSGSGEEKADS
jgi:hypothetical protein